MNDNDDNLKLRHEVGSWFDRIKLPFNRFYLFLLIVIIIAIVLGGISFRIYQLSGAEALDLSRPSYKDKREEITIKQDQPTIDSSGGVDADFQAEVLTGLEYYKTNGQVDKQFSNEAITDEALGLVPSQ